VNHLRQEQDQAIGGKIDADAGDRDQPDCGIGQRIADTEARHLFTLGAFARQLLHQPLPVFSSQPACPAGAIRHGEIEDQRQRDGGQRLQQEQPLQAR